MRLKPTSFQYLKSRLEGFVFDPTKHWSEYPCIEWERRRSEHGYGIFTHQSRGNLAHRVAYNLIRGSIPDDLEIDHLCRNKPCFCPAHLEAVTHIENLRRAPDWTEFHSRKTHCPQGHPYTAENTRMYQGRRFCRECGRDAERKYKLRLKMEKQKGLTVHSKSV